MWRQGSEAEKYVLICGRVVAGTCAPHLAVLELDDKLGEWSELFVFSKKNHFHLKHMVINKYFCEECRRAQFFSAHLKICGGTLMCIKALVEFLLLQHIFNMSSLFT